jgi:hypothetical protein
LEQIEPRLGEEVVIYDGELEVKGVLERSVDEEGIWVARTGPNFARPS